MIKSSMIINGNKKNPKIDDSIPIINDAIIANMKMKKTQNLKILCMFFQVKFNLIKKVMFIFIF